jgi:large subunit ribosomal protein L21
MYAIIKCGGQQLKVAKGDVITVNQMQGDVGSTIKLDQVILLGGDKVTVGTPTVAGASVEAQVVEHKRGEKVIVFKMRRRKNYRRTRGHRQELTVLKITGISAK